MLAVCIGGEVARCCVLLLFSYQRVAQQEPAGLLGLCAPRHNLTLCVCMRPNLRVFKFTNYTNEILRWQKWQRVVVKFEICLTWMCKT